MKLTPQERAAKHDEKVRKELRPIGLQAALKNPRAKLWAKVNHEDNFVLAIKGFVHGALIDEISDFYLESTEDVDWFNDICKSQRGGSKFDAFVIDIAREAYQTLRA